MQRKENPHRPSTHDQNSESHAVAVTTSSTLDAIASPLFRLVQCLVGSGEGLNDRFAGLVLGHTDRYGQMAQRTRCRKLERADPLAQALGIRHGARQRGMAHDLNKFFAAVTPEDIARAQSLLHCLRKSLQDAIARQMIELVVVALEEIEIDDANRKRFAGEVSASFRLFHGN